MTTHVIVKNHGFNIQVTSQEKDSSGIYQNSHVQLYGPEISEIDLTIWDTKRVIVEEVSQSAINAEKQEELED